MSELYADSIQAKVNGTSQSVPIRDITKAPAIIESASGESIQLSDSGDAPLTDIKLYGKSKQVTTTGAQLFDMTTIINEKWISNTSGIIVYSPGYWVSDYIPVSYGNTYYLFGVNRGSVRASFFNADKTQARYSPVSNGQVVPNEGESYFVICGTTGNEENTMLNKGSSALPWEPYTGGEASPSPDYPQEIEIPGSEGNVEIESVGANLYDLDSVGTYYDNFQSLNAKTSATLPTPNGLPGIPVTSAGNYTDADGQQWVCDEIDYARGKYVQRVKKRELLASDNWLTSGSRLRQYVRLDDAEIGIYSPIISNYFKMGIWTNDNVGTICLGDGYDPLCGVSTKDFESIEAIKTWLREKSSAGNPCYVIYKLLTPIETDLTTEQLAALKQLRTFQTTTNITTDSEPQVGMEVEYTVDTKTYIDNKMNEIQTQLLNMKTQEV